MLATVTLNPSLDEWLQLPRLAIGSLNRVRRFERYPGGKGINVSRVAHELGVRTLAIALAGGLDGQMLSFLLAQRGIPHRFIEVAGSTRNNYQIATTHPARLTQLNCPGPCVSASALRRVRRLLMQQHFTPRCVVFSGSLPPGAPTASYAAMIRDLRRRRIPAVLDTSGPALRQGVRARPWLIKPNREEAEALLGARLRAFPEGAAEAASELVRRGAAVAILSLGSTGAVLASSASPAIWWARPPRIRVGSTVGAGDSLVAGFVIGWWRTRSLEQALRLGVACGTASAMTDGTQLCQARDVQRLLGRVTLRSLPPTG